MMTVALLLAATALLSLALTGFLASPRAVFKILDTPNARSLHRSATPRTGGVAILIAVVAGLGAAAAATRFGVAGDLLRRAALEFRSGDVMAIVAAILVLGLVSLVNDRREVSPALRLFFQIAAGAGLIIVGNLTITSFMVPFIGPMRLGWWTYPVTLLFLVWMTNLYNFMDGMDGFAGGMTLIGFGFLGGLALQQGAYSLGIIALVTAAAASGFLVFNYPPARIFMGDVGAVPLGLLAGALAVKGNQEQAIGLWTPIILFSPFIVDATVVLFRRALRGARIWEPHREHYYQRLVLAGWSHRRTVLVEYALMVGWGSIAVVYELRGEVGHVVVLAIGVAVYSLLAIGVRRVERRSRRRPERLIRVVR